MMKRECRAAAKNERDHCWSFDRTSLGLSRAMMVELYRLSIIYIYIDYRYYRLSIIDSFPLFGCWLSRKKSTLDPKKTQPHNTTRHGTVSIELRPTR